MTLSEIRFTACRESADAYVRSFQTQGRSATTELAKGAIEAGVGALRHLEGEAAAYFFVQKLADDIAAGMIDAGKGEL